MHFDPAGDSLRNNDQMTCKCQKLVSDKRDNTVVQVLKHFKLNTAQLRKDILPSTQPNQLNAHYKLSRCFEHQNKQL